MRLPVRRPIRVAIGAALLAIIVVVLIAEPAFAVERNRHRDSAVTITGRVDVLTGETVDGTVVSIDGPVRVAGTVDGDVYVVDGNVNISGAVNGIIVVIHGDVTISGRVDDDVTVIDGRAVVSGVVRGDVRSSEKPRVTDDGRVTGDVDKTDFAGYFTALGFALLALLWIAVSISLLVVGVVLFALFPRAGRALVNVAHTAVGRAAGWGAIIAIGVPLVAGFAISTLVGLPLGLGALLALGLLFCLGYVVSAAALGQRILKERSPLIAFLAGFGVLRVAAIIPGLGVLVWILASAYGVGVLAVAAYRAGRDEPSIPDTSTTPPPADNAPVTSA
jgi:cytoskeletal protein CcmA (bactofilin family)